MRGKTVRTLLILAIVGGCWAACSFEPYTYYGGTSTVLTNREIFKVDYGFRGNELRFVIFEHASMRLVPLARLRVRTLPSGQSVCEGTLPFPDGRNVNLAKAKRGFQISKGTISEFPLTFSRTELELFLESRPNAYDLEALNRFLSERKNERR